VMVMREWLDWPRRSLLASSTISEALRSAAKARKGRKRQNARRANFMDSRKHYTKNPRRMALENIENRGYNFLVNRVVFCLALGACLSVSEAGKAQKPLSSSAAKSEKYDVSRSTSPARAAHRAKKSSKSKVRRSAGPPVLKRQLYFNKSL